MALHPWNYHSAVKACSICNGEGVVPAYRRATINDPYPQNTCECGLGEHEPCCEVCGFTQPVSGFDCLVCETVACLTDKDFAKLDVDALAEAIKVAVKARADGAAVDRRLAA